MIPVPLLSRLAWSLAAESAADGVAHRVSHGLRELLHADGAAVTVEASAPHRVTLCVTDRRADLLENLHDVLGEGPGMDACDSGRQVRAALDRSAMNQWPRFTPAAAGVIGWGGLLWSVPMRSAGQTIGAVTLYRMFPEPPGGPDADAQFLADLAASSLARDPAAYRPVTDSACHDCWSSRALVHQATGMLISQLGVGAGEALRRLRDYAAHTGRHLSEVAGDVVGRRLEFVMGAGPRYRQVG